MKKLVAKILKSWQTFIVLLTIFSISLFIGSYYIISFIVTKKTETEIQSYKGLIVDYKLEIDQYKNNTEDFIKIQRQYREYTNEIVRLLYNKESYLGTGGSSSDLVVDDSTTNIFLLKQALKSQQDNLVMMGQVKDYLVARKQFVESFPFIWPIRITGVPEITSGFGVRMNSLHKVDDKGIHFHAGIDIRGKFGDDIIATANGRVYQVWDETTSLGLHPIYGRLVIIIHDYGFKTYYGHQSKIIVKMGQKVDRGQKIGEMGNSGMSYGTHLHYEIRKDNIAVDPLNFLSINY